VLRPRVDSYVLAIPFATLENEASCGLVEPCRRRDAQPIGPRETEMAPPATPSVQSAATSMEPSGKRRAPAGIVARAKAGVPRALESWRKHSGNAESAHGASPAMLPGSESGPRSPRAGPGVPVAVA
jgi:hypothetical protein